MSLHEIAIAVDSALQKLSQSVWNYPIDWNTIIQWTIILAVVIFIFRLLSDFVSDLRSWYRRRKSQ
jgi:hypothetical protein